jgi:hypothetical protein
VTVKRKRDLRVLEPEQVFASRAIERSHPDTWMAGLIVFAAFSGLRPGECRAIRWQDVDFANGAIRVRRSQSEGFVEGTPKSGACVALRAPPMLLGESEWLAGARCSLPLGPGGLRVSVVPWRLPWLRP